MRGQLAVRTPLPHPARRDRVIHRVARHRVDQHPEGHLIRTHQRINRHDTDHSSNTSHRRHATPKTTQNRKINLGYVALGPTLAGVFGRRFE